MGLLAENHFVAFFIVTGYRSPLPPDVFGRDLFFFFFLGWIFKLSGLNSQAASLDAIGRCYGRSGVVMGLLYTSSDCYLVSWFNHSCFQLTFPVVLAIVMANLCVQDLITSILARDCTSDLLKESMFPIQTLLWFVEEYIFSSPLSL